MLVPVEIRHRGDDAVIDISAVMEDSTAATSATDQQWGLFPERWWDRTVWASALVEQPKISFHPRVLVTTKDNAGAVGVEEKDCAVWGRSLEEKVLDAKVQVGGAVAGDVDLVDGCWIRYQGC